jgi:hypothetical protein
MHFTPTAVLEVILMLPPLGIYIDGEARHVNYRFSSPQGTKSFLLLLLEEGF